MHLYIPATRCCRCWNTLRARPGCLFSNMRSLSSGVKVLTLHQTNWSTPLKVGAFKHQCFTLDKQAWLSGSSHQCKNVTQWSPIGRRRRMHGVVFMSILHERSHPRGLQHCWCSFDTLLSRSAVEWRNATGRARNEKTTLVLNREIIEIQACEGWWMNWYAFLIGGKHLPFLSGVEFFCILLHACRILALNAQKKTFYWFYMFFSYFWSYWKCASKMLGIKQLKRKRAPVMHLTCT